MLKVVDKQVIFIFKQAVIIETMTTTKERTFAIYLHLFLLSGFSFTNIHDSQESRRRGRLFLKLLSTTSTTLQTHEISWVINAEDSSLHIVGT